MIPIQADFLLDALCLAVFSDTDETKLLLDSVLVLYRESKKKNPDIFDPDLDVFIDIISDIVHSDVDLGKRAELNRIVLKVKKSPLAQKDSTITDNVISILKDNDESTPKRILQLTNKVQQWVAFARTRVLLGQAFTKCNKFDPTDAPSNDILLTELLNYARGITEVQDNLVRTAATIDMIDMTDPNSVKRAMLALKTKHTSNSFKTGLKALNRMLGPGYGFTRGSFVAFAASSHNYKTGILLKAARWLVTKSTYTVPVGMMPTVLFLSLENEVPENASSLIAEAYIDIYREPVPPDMKEEELITRICEYYAQKNVKFLMYRFDENFGFSDFVKLQTELKNKGHTVLATVIDYMTLMKLEGDESDNPAKRLQKLANHLANFFKRWDQLGVTGLQLDAKADELKASGRTNVVKLFNATHLADAKGIRRELDVLIFLNIEHNQDGVPYLTGAWSKHRGPAEPSKKDKYFAYRFHPVLGILEDEDTEYEYSVPDIYSVEAEPEEAQAGLFLNSDPNKHTVKIDPDGDFDFPS